MKVFFVFCASIACASAADWTFKTREEIIAIREKCMKENKAPENLVAENKKYQYADEESVRCHIRCSAEKGGTWDDEKGFYVDRMVLQFTKVDKTVNKDDLNKCIDQNDQKSDKCVWAYRQFKCKVDNKYLSAPAKT